jgi:hypothetical protein
VADLMRWMLHSVAHPLVGGSLRLAALHTAHHDTCGGAETVEPRGLPTIVHRRIPDICDWFGVPSRRELAVRHDGGYICRAVLVATAVNVGVGDLPQEQHVSMEDLASSGSPHCSHDTSPEAGSSVRRWNWGGTVPAIPLAAAHTVEPHEPFPWKIPPRYDELADIHHQPHVNSSVGAPSKP